jgi:hypothetical protein
MNDEKKLIKLIRIFKRLTGLVQFWFYKPETEGTELKKPETKTKPNRKK